MTSALWRAREGVSTVEFAFVGGILCLFLLGLLDFGLGFWEQMQVGNAARAGAAYAVSSYNQSGFDASDIQASVTNAAGLAAIQASPSPVQSCGCPISSGVNTVTCNATCTDGSAPGTYITVNAQASYRTIFSWPGISNPITLSASTVVRVN
jgi:Flp pilus assembly protein TadG